MCTDAMTSSQQSSGDYWDDDWDDDSEVGQTQAYVPPTQQQQQTIQVAQQNNTDHSNLMPVHTIHSVIPERPIPNVPKKNNKFSTLIKSGEDSFLLGVKQVNVPESERLFIEESEGRCTWVPTGETYNCVVTSPKKESKLKGLKSFIVYQLTPTVSKDVSFFRSSPSRLNAPSPVSVFNENKNKTHLIQSTFFLCITV